MPDEQAAPAPDQAVILPATSDQALDTTKEDQAQAEPAGLVYLYLGGAAIIGIPARDIEASELAELGITTAELLATGLYLLRSSEI